MTGPAGISVVIPTYQRCASVRRTLEALTRQAIAASEYEVIVAIDGSDDGTKEMIEGFQAPYRLSAVWQPNQGRAAARNAGIRLARGDLVVFLDDDMEPVPGFLLAHRDAHPPGSRRAVVGPAPILAEASSPPIVHYRRSGMSAHQDRMAQPGYTLGFRDIYTGNLSLDRSVLLEVGGFDETFRLYGHEDYELGLRLLKAGVNLLYRVEATAYQRYDKDFGALARDCVARGRTAVLFARKHPDVASGLKLATYDAGPRSSRFLRSAMLRLGDWVPGFAEWVIRAMTWLERRRPRRLYGYYTFALDYFFWTGARAAFRESAADAAAGAPAPAGEPRPIGSAGGSREVRWMRIGWWLLALFGLASSARLLARSLHDVPRIDRPDETTRYEGRFRELRTVLPPRVRVGYVADRLPAGAADDPALARLAFKRYVLTQYALLPAIVLPDTAGSGLVVGDFEAPGGRDSAAARGLTLIRDLGQGVLLLRTSPE